MFSSVQFVHHYSITSLNHFFYIYLIKTKLMKSSILDSSYNPNLYKSSVNAATQLPKSYSQRRPSHQFSSKTKSNNYLTPGYPTDRNKQDQYLRITISTMQKKEQHGNKSKIEPFLRSSLNEKSYQTRPESMYQGSPLLGSYQGSRKIQKGDIFRQTQRDKKYEQRIKNVSQTNGNVSNILQKIKQKDKIYKQLQQLYQNKVSDNIRKSSYQPQKSRVDQSYNGKITKYGTGTKNLNISSLNLAKQAGSSLQVPGNLNRDLTKSSDYKYNKDAGYSYLNEKDGWKKGEKKELQIPALSFRNKNPEEQFLSKDGFQKIHASYLTPRQSKTNKELDSYTLQRQQFKIQKKQKFNPYKAKLDLLNVQTFQSFQRLQQIPQKYQRNDSSYRSYSNIEEIPASTRIEPASATIKKSREYDDNTKDRKNIKDMRQIAETKNIKNNSNYFSHSKISIYDFQLKKSLGQGKFGLVFQAFHIQTQSLYAIKKISKKVIKSNLMVDQLLQQIKIQSFCDHQNILKIYGFFDDSEFIYLILQYMEQGTLFSQLKKQKTLTQQQAAIKLKQLASAITYLHQNGIAHRDIKPQNIVMSNGVGKLCDFGWAAICTDRRKTYCGTFDYVAPEILQGSEYDISVDLWCLGVLAYELMVGKAPFYHISRKETMKKIMNVQKTALEFPPNMSKNAVSFMQSLIKKNPEQRLSGQHILKHPFLATISEVGQ